MQDYALYCIFTNLLICVKLKFNFEVTQDYKTNLSLLKRINVRQVTMLKLPFHVPASNELILVGGNRFFKVAHYLHLTNYDPACSD